MERAQGTKTSPGSLYFQNEDSFPATKKECLDFIPFSSSTPSRKSHPQNEWKTPSPKQWHSPHKGSFQPRNFSSPRNDQSPYYDSSPVHSRNHSWQGHSFNNRMRGNNKGYTPRKSFQGLSNQGNKSFNNQNFPKFDPQTFIHPSFTEDPWAELEKKLSSKNEEAIKQNET